MSEFSSIELYFEGTRSDRIERAIEVFTNEIARRSRVIVTRAGMYSDGSHASVVVTTEHDLAALIAKAPFGAAIAVELEGLAIPRSEGYRIVTLPGTWPTIVVAGADDRGVLYGLGRVLRNLEIRSDRIALPEPLRLSSSPQSSLRGHQLGYRPKTNAYDMWSHEQYEQYIIDLALFGLNAIELLPPRTDDYPRTPEMLYDPLEMMKHLSGFIHDLGLDVWIWYPNMSEDFSLPQTIEMESAEREEVYSALPYVDAVLIPGGDPGDQEPAVLFDWGRIQSEILRKHHPNARIWISAQIFNYTAEWQGAFLHELGKSPEWLGGVCHGPWVKGDPKAFRQAVPLQYPIRRYPDITHSVSCQYPVRDWDQALAGTLGRECYNPRPLDFERIHNVYADYADGSITYSEGINDDVNKFIWSDQDWDTTTPVRRTLVEFGRLFISPDYANEIADGLLDLEQNWRGPLLSNGAVHITFSRWQRIERALPELVDTNYRLVMALVRAYYDEYVQRRLRIESGVEETIMSAIESLTVENVDAALKAIEATLAANHSSGIAYLKERCVELADKAFELIRWQTSVERHKGQAVVRGCFLDAIDYPISDLPFYADALRQARAAGGAAAVAIMQDALKRARPTTGGRFVSLATVEDNEEVVRDCTWEEDPSVQSVPYVVLMPAPFPDYEGAPLESQRPPLVPAIERAYASTMYCKPMRVRFTGLDPRARYRMRACYVMHRRRAGMMLTAGKRVVHDYLVTEGTHENVEYLLPEGCVDGAGVLELTWQARPARVYSEGVAWVIVEKDE